MVQPGRAGLMTALGCLLALAGCEQKDTSRLQEASGAKRSSGNSAAGDPPASDDTSQDPGPDSADPPPKLDPEPPEGAELHDVRLALEEGTDYRVLTVGLVRLPAVMKPIGFAREEGIVLSDCKGEAFERSCLLTHRYLEYEAEKPNGGPLEADEKRVDQLVTKHRITSAGKREGSTEVSGPAEQADAPAGKALADEHRFFCLRFPEQPIAEGATWPDKCARRVGGRVATRDLIWTLDSVTDSPEGKRALLKAAGKFTVTDAESGEVREGTVQSVLFFFLDAGEPHSLKEQITLPLAGSTLATTTNLTIQFAKVDPADPEKKLLTDGRPYVAPERTHAAPPDEGADAGEGMASDEGKAGKKEAPAKGPG